MDDRVERLRVDRCAGERGDRLGRRVGLLRGDPAELDGEIGRVARGVDTLEPRNLAMDVDRDEPTRRCGRNTRKVDGPRAEAGR